MSITADRGLRIGIGLVFAGTVGMVVSYRQTAQGGETFSLEKEGWRIAVLLRLGGLALWLYLPAYLLAPGWMAWSTYDLPMDVRWFGLAIAALVVPPFVAWAQRSLGDNVLPTVVTSKNHELATHPLSLHPPPALRRWGCLLLGYGTGRWQLVSAPGSAGRLPCPVGKDSARGGWASSPFWRALSELHATYRSLLPASGRAFPARRFRRLIDLTDQVACSAAKLALDRLLPPREDPCIGLAVSLRGSQRQVLSSTQPIGAQGK
jgi:hypothetical protein